VMMVWLDSRAAFSCNLISLINIFAFDGCGYLAQAVTISQVLLNLLL